MNAPLPAAFRGATVRFQAGAYQQDSSGTTAPGPDDGARVTFSALSAGPPAVARRCCAGSSRQPTGQVCTGSLLCMCSA